MGRAFVDGVTALFDDAVVVDKVCKKCCAFKSVSQAKSLPLQAHRQQCIECSTRNGAVGNATKAFCVDYPHTKIRIF